jgi:type VI secretion system protein ImpM
MPGARPVAPSGPTGIGIGLFGKLPAHGDFVRRGTLPASFTRPWDDWVQDGMQAARDRLGDARWASAWDGAPAWRFALPAGACGPKAAAGVLLTSQDGVGRRFPLTLAAVRTGDGAWDWPAAWFAALEGAGRAAILDRLDADSLAVCLPEPGECAGSGLGAASPPIPSGGDPLAAFWQALESASGERAFDGAALGSAADEGPAPASAPAEPQVAAALAAAPLTGWWTATGPDGTPGLVWPLQALPAAEEFVLLLESQA